MSNLYLVRGSISYTRYMEEGPERTEARAGNLPRQGQ